MSETQISDLTTLGSPAMAEVSPIGKDVRILRCEAREHGDNLGCVCYLIGGVERIAKRSGTALVGVPTYHLLGRSQRVRLTEVEIIDDAP